jgi:hypothetical protein
MSSTMVKEHEFNNQAHGLVLLTVAPRQRLNILMVLFR